MVSAADRADWRIVVAAGGTGGHVFPALALGEELRRLGATVVWVGRRGGLENEVALKQGFAFESLPARGFFGKGIGQKFVGLWFGLVGLFRALGLLRRLAPRCVVATGGFAPAAVLAAALLNRVPFFLLEQNCIPGRVTRLFARRARESFLGFAPAGQFPGPYVVTGNPLRGPLARGSRSDDGRTVLVLGGSQGAKALNLAALDAAAALATLNFIVVTGRRDYEYIRGRRCSANLELVDFTARPEELYRRATICVSRAGGMVLSELVAFNIPAILIPFPYATDRHQDANAQHLAAVGAASVLNQARLSGLTNAIKALMDNEAERRRMEQAARALARPDAAGVIARRIADALERHDREAEKSRAPGPNLPPKDPCLRGSRNPTLSHAKHERHAGVGCTSGFRPSARISWSSWQSTSGLGRVACLEG